MSPRERMAQMFDAIDADGRRYVLGVLQHEFDRVQRTRRPTLQLIAGGRAPAAPLTTVSATTQPQGAAR